MAVNPITIAIEAVNKTGAAFAQVNKDLKSFEANNKAAVDASKKFAVGLAAVGAAALGFAYMAVKAAGEAQRLTASMDATLRATGLTGKAFDGVRGQIMATSQAMIKLGFDDEETAATMAKLYQRTNDVTEAQKLTALAADLARAKQISLADAGNMVGMVMSGNGKVLKQYGIEIDETLTPMQQLEQLQLKVAGQGEAFAKSFEGQMAVLNVAWGNFMEEVGVQFLPILTKIVKAAAVFVEGPLTQWIEKTKELIGWLREHQTVIYIVAGAIMGALVPATIAWGIAMTQAAIASAVALAPFYITGAVIGGVVAGLVWLWKNSDMVQKAIIKGWEWVKKAWGDIIDYLVNKLTKLVNLQIRLITLGVVKNAIPAASSSSGGGFATGGIVPGPVGMGQLALVHGGETITPAAGLRPAAAGPGGITINISADVIAGDRGIRNLADMVGDQIMQALRSNTKF